MVKDTSPVEWWRGWIIKCGMVGVFVDEGVCAKARNMLESL